MDLGAMDTGGMVDTDSEFLTTAITDEDSTTTPYTVSIRIETNTTTIIPYILIDPILSDTAKLK